MDFRVSGPPPPPPHLYRRTPKKNHPQTLIYFISLFLSNPKKIITFTNIPPHWYGTELYSRDQIRTSKRISNPGCYATSSQLLIAPLLQYLHRGAWPTVFGVSGYSGAGTITGPPSSSSSSSDTRPTTQPKVPPSSLKGGIRPYALTNHIHEREASFHLSKLLIHHPEETNVVVGGGGGIDGGSGGGGGDMKIAFIPVVAPWFSGILSTVSMPVKGRVNAKEVEEVYGERYRGEKLIRVIKDVPSLGDVEGQHGWVVGGVQVHSDGDRVVVVVCLFCLLLLF